jgi:hypothetical protein
MKYISGQKEIYPDFIAFGFLFMDFETFNGSKIPLAVEALQHTTENDGIKKYTESPAVSIDFATFDPFQQTIKRSE